MGLSDGERYNGVAATVDEMSRLTRFKYPHEALNPLLDRLWPDFVGETSNGLHWVVGSDSSAASLGECSLLGAAFARSRPEKDALDELRRERRAGKDRDATDWLYEYKPRAESILGDGCDGDQARIWRLQLLIESHFYRANRYPGDELATRLAPLTRTVCAIQGHIYNAMASDPIYAIAWMMQHICDRCFVYDAGDVVTRAGDKFNWHHNIRARGQDYDRTMATFKRCQFGKVSPEWRLLTVLGIIGSAFHYKHQHADLLALVREWNVGAVLALDLRRQGLDDAEIAAEMSVPSMRAGALAHGPISEIRIQKLCSAAAAKHKDAEARPYEQFCHFTDQSSGPKWRPRRTRKKANA